MGREAENDKVDKGKGDDEGDDGNATQSLYRHPSLPTPSTGLSLLRSHP